jgi:hypothetical protein
VEPPVGTGALIVPGSDWEIQPRTESPYVAAVNATLLAEVGDRCAIGSACPLLVGGEQAFIEAIIGRLRAKGLAAGRQVENGDKVAVGLSQLDNWTFHVVGFGSATRPPTVAWQPSKAEPPDHWIAPGPPAPDCLSLSWIKLDVQDGKALRHINATPQHRGAADCDSIGYPARGDCPLGPEGGTLRPFCEAKHAPWTWSVTPDPGWDLAVEPSTGLANPLVIKLQARQEGVVKVCSAEGICGEIATVKPQ